MTCLTFASAFLLLGLASATCNQSDTLASSSISAILNEKTGVTCACNKLLRSYPSQVIFPGSANYTTQAIDIYWDIRAAMYPACVFMPTTANQVADAVVDMTSCNAQFAVRGGGHMNFPGAANINGGVLIALSGLSKYKVLNNTIEVDAGLTWYDVYSALDPYGRIAIGGRIKSIGVPGLTLIGGVHYLSNRYGYAMDNVISYDVVLGNGTQVTASKKSHPDLFWALKGGSSNFGIVTKFTLETHYVPQITTTVQSFNESAVFDFITASCDLAKSDRTEPIAAGVVTTVGYNVTTNVVHASIQGVQEGVSNPPSQFANFTNIPGPVKQHNVTTLKQWMSKLESPKQMFRVTFAQHSVDPNPQALHEIYLAWKDAVDQIADVEGLYPTFVLNLGPASTARVAKANGIGNVWGLDDKPLIWWQFVTGWAHAEDDMRVEAWSRQLATRLHAANKAKGIASEFVYMGEAGEWQDPYAGFKAENVVRMREIRAAYDPLKTFSKLNWGGFKMGF